MSFAKKISELEKQKQELITKRKEQIFELLESTSSLDIDDQTLAGALIFLKNSANQNHEITKQFQEVAKANKIKIPSRKY